MKNFISTKFCTLFFALSVGVLFSSCQDSNSTSIDSDNIVKEVVEVETITPSYFLFLSDIHLDSYGHGTTQMGVDDTKMDLWKLATDKLHKVVNSSTPPKFIIYTGDLPGHWPDEGNDHDTNIRLVLDGLSSIAGNIPLFYAPGNNDALGGDYHSFANKNGKTPFSVLPGKSNYPALNADTIYSNHKLFGYYSASPFKGLRIIALNSVLLGQKYVDDHCSVADTACSRKFQLQDGEDQMNWLGNQLEEAKNNNEMVYIIMHIPPGANAYMSYCTPMWKETSWTSSFLADTDKYSATIKGIFYGHTHMDEVRRMTSSQTPGSFSEVAISCPGITPLHDNNPGFKTVKYDNSLELIDFTTHYTTYDSIKGTWGVNGTWGNLTYQFSTVYGSNGKNIYECLSSMPLNQITSNMEKTYKVYNGNGPSTIECGIDVK